MKLAGLYHAAINWIGDGTGAADSLLHVHAGLAVLFLARILTRRWLATPVPFLVVCTAELFNEVMDPVHFGYWPPDTLNDVIQTLFGPLVLMLGLRWRRAHENAPRN